MPQQTLEQLAAQKPEGSFERQNAVRAARRRLMERRDAQPVDNALIDQISDDAAEKHKAAYSALISAINTAAPHGSSMAEMMKAVARSALKKSFPDHAPADHHAVAAE